jgi:glycosyltransferase involved in cell wall biosynthesis
MVRSRSLRRRLLSGCGERDAATPRRRLVKVGLIARGEDRGLGNLTWEFARHVKPERVLLVHMGELARGFEMHASRYESPTVVSFDGVSLPEATVREWLDGLDVVYSAETFYDHRLPDWCRDAGVRSILHVMPEFYREHVPQPDEIWLPTIWRADLVPNRRHEIVPVPVALDRWPVRQNEIGGTMRVLHVAGRRAANDRNGTNLVLAAANRLIGDVEVVVTCQDPMRQPSRRGLVVRAQNEPDYWKLYRDFDVLLMPRRFGGLCLPAQEAAAAGLALVMTDCTPNSSWPIVPIVVRQHSKMRTPGGDVHLANATSSAVADAVNRLARDRDLLAVMRTRARGWAIDRSWSTLLPTYRGLLGCG